MDREGAPATHYTNYPFIQILRFGNDYYGVAQDGLYLIGGALDGTEVIPWEWETARSDFGSKHFKCCKSLYIGGRFESNVTATVQREADSLTYQYTAPRSTPMTHRIMVGKGTRERYYAFGLSDDNGGYFEIDTLEPEIVELARSV